VEERIVAEQQTASGEVVQNLLPPNSRTETSFQKPLAFVAAGQKISVILGDVVLAVSEHVIIVHEQGHTPVLYFPRGDVRLGLSVALEKMSHCPRKGDASYYEFVGVKGSAIAWSYENPIPPAAMLKDYIAFYPDHLEFQREA
jgi:uncharacterized protein (DUF427 family)